MKISLDDKYELTQGQIYVTGTQALARLPLLQKRRDQRSGLRTAGYVSGYRGSPLGTLDQALSQARRFTEANAIVVRPGLNEDLAATAVWGTQKVNAMEGAKYDGVFALWYGKGPGVDRSGDVFKHGNSSGTSRHGGVLLVAGDDHAAKSSTLPHQSDYAFIDAGIPILSPAGIQEFAEFGILGWAMSRLSGCWVGFKAVASAVESSASVDAAAGLDRAIVMPEGLLMPPGGLHIRITDDWWEPEARLYNYKLPAAKAFARINSIDRIVLEGGNHPRLGLLTAGKAYLDVMDALNHLGVDAIAAAQLGIRVYKLGLVWPVEPEGLAAFARGLDEILVVEEKRPIIEDQVKAVLFTHALAIRIIGKNDDEGRPLLPTVGELDSLRLALAIGKRLAKLGITTELLASQLTRIERQAKASTAVTAESFLRPPHYCSGCPHNTSTVVPEGSQAAAGIGCHIMARLMDRNTTGFTQMGGEGAQWVGMAPFTETKHLFQNLGDGTYFHSGSLAIRQAVAANINITYKILFNDGVAMTGGQPVDGVLTVRDVVRQVIAENVQRVDVVSDDIDKYPPGTFDSTVVVHHRDSLNAVQRALREVAGVTVLIYDQMCAAEKRRRRKRGRMVDPARRTFINDLVCEGCGDCSVKSNCLSVVPVVTEFGTKRTIEQSSCNKDFSCLHGFCPSFVTVEGGQLKKRFPNDNAGEFSLLPSPDLQRPTGNCNIVIAGVGGTGVVTVGALIGMAAHIEGRGVSVLDITGAAQKGGTVFSHVRLSAMQGRMSTPRIQDGEADLIIGSDIVVTASAEVLRKVAKGRTFAIVNTHETITSEFTRKSPSYMFPSDRLRGRITDAIGPESSEFVEASRIATALLGDSIGVNLFVLGYAWQKGLVPVSAKALDQAIELNGVAVELNRQAFLWGRRTAHNLAAVEQIIDAMEDKPQHHRLSENFEEVVARRVAFLTEYQDAAYAARYERTVKYVADAESTRAIGHREFADAVARNLFKLMAYKDEYEVARLYADTTFLKRLEQMFEGDWRINFHLAPPILDRPSSTMGRARKRAFGPWILNGFRVLARLRRLRGTALDPFGLSSNRRAERRYISDYETMLSELCNKLNGENHQTAVALARLPDNIRGYGHIKSGNVERTKTEQARLLEEFRQSKPRVSVVAMP